MEKGSFKMTARLYAVLKAICEEGGGTVADLRVREPYSAYYDLRTCLDRLVDKGFLKVKPTKTGKFYYSRSGPDVPSAPGRYYRGDT